MFCSSIIATVGRPTLERAVDSILGQSAPGLEFEIIVVNDSGAPLPPAPWQRSELVRQIVTRRRERCVARNTGAAAARGRYLHFLDDDDWLLPEAFQNFQRLSKAAPDAVWLYGASELVDRDSRPLITLRHQLSGNTAIQALAGEWLPLQASVIRTTAFFGAGGFNPRIPGIEDIHLFRQISFQGAVAGLAEPVAAITMGLEGSLTDYPRAQELGREARELLFDLIGAFERLRLAASTSFWQGRVVRAYLTSAAWNLKNLRISTALSRGLCGLAAGVLSSKSVFSQEFWEAVIRPYESKTFLEGFNEADRPIERRDAERKPPGPKRVSGQ